MSDGLFKIPLENEALVSHEDAVQRFLEAWAGDRLHHAWLIGGAEGIGKATLAHAIARFLVANDDGSAAQDGLFGDAGLEKTVPSSLAVDAEDARVRMVLQHQHPDVKVIEPTHLDEAGKERAACELRIYQIRALYEWFAHTSAGGGVRVVIIDSVDSMNQNAANALLKLLEEPPEQTIFLLISHAPGGVLPTIRSRCRMLSLRPLAEEQVRTAVEAASSDMLDPVSLKFALREAAGSPGMAVKLYLSDAGALYDQMLKAFDEAGSPQISALESLFATVNAQEGGFDVLVYLYQRALERCVRYASGVATETPSADEQPLFDAWLATCGLDALIDVWENSARISAEVEHIHMDKSAAFMTMIGELNAA